jgi:hypothetical protein
MERMTAKNTKKYCETLILSSRRLLEQGASRLSSTRTEKKSLQEEALKCMFLILHSLSQEPISSNIWILAINRAKSIAENKGISKKVMKKVITAFLSERQKGWSGLFERSGFM